MQFYQSKRFFLGVGVLSLACIMAIVFLVLPFLGFASAAAEPAVMIEYADYYIKSKSSGLYLEVKGNATKDETPIIQNEFTGKDNQKFRVIPSGDIYFIESRSSGKNVDIHDISSANNAKVQIYKPNTTKAQQFRIVDSGKNEGSFKVLTAASSFKKCLDVEENSLQKKANIIQYTDTGANNQTWFFEKIQRISMNQTAHAYVGRGSVAHFELSLKQKPQFALKSYLGNASVYKNNKKYAHDTSNDLPGSEDPLTFMTYFSADATDGFVARVSPMYSTGNRVEFSFKPTKVVTFNATKDPNDKDNPYDFEKYVLDYVDSLNKMGYYVYINTNQYSSVLKTQTMGDYYLISAHGSVDSRIQFKAGDSYGITYSYFPDMPNTELAVFLTCYSAISQRGIARDIAQKRSAQYTIGFNGSFVSAQGHHFAKQLWKQLADGKDIKMAFTKARNSTSTHYWANFWQYNAAKCPVLFNKDGVVAYFECNHCENGSYHLGNPRHSSSSTSFQENKNGIYSAYSDENGTIYAHYIDGILTNEIYTENALGERIYTSTAQVNARSLTTLKARAAAYTVEDSILTDLSGGFVYRQPVDCQYYYANIDGRYALIRWDLFNHETADGMTWMTETYTDVTTGVEITSEQFMTYFYGGLEV